MNGSSDPLACLAQVCEMQAFGGSDSKTQHLYEQSLNPMQAKLASDRIGLETLGNTREKINSKHPSEVEGLRLETAGGTRGSLGPTLR